MEHMEDKLNDIKIDKETLYQRLRELDEEEFKLKNQGVLNQVNTCLGKFYQRSKPSDPNTIELFAPQKVEFVDGHILDVVGLYIKGNTFAPDDRIAYIETKNSMRASEFLKDYEETEEEEWKEKISEILDII